MRASDNHGNKATDSHLVDESIRGRRVGVGYHLYIKAVSNEIRELSWHIVLLLHALVDVQQLQRQGKVNAEGNL